MSLAASRIAAVGFAAMIGCWAASGLAETEPEGDSAEETSRSGSEEAAGERDDDGLDEMLAKGREAYNAKNYQKAAERFVEAAQAHPDRPEPYRNLARTHFWREQYARAGTYYDHYLQLADEPEDLDKVKRERKHAAERAGDEVWQRPKSQRRVLEALREELTDGEAYTEGGGGAWALYEALLRTGYAAPELAHLQKRLRKRLIDEYEGLLVSERDQPVPGLSLEEWQRQQMRLEAARSIAESAGVRKIIDRRMTIADAAIALLNGRHEEAADLASEAIEGNPDMPFVHWYRAVALVQADRPEQAREALRTFEKQTDADGSEREAYLEILRGIVAHRDGDTASAAEAYRTILNR